MTSRPGMLHRRDPSSGEYDVFRSGEAIVRRFIFRVVDKFVKWHQDYLAAKLVNKLHFCGARVLISPDARIWGTHGVTLEDRSEEHTSELQSLRHLVCRLLL